MKNLVATAFRNLGREAARLAQNDDAVTSIEYALIGALIAIVIVVSVANVGAAVQGLYEFVAKEVAAAV